jgi:hypothetical protein
MVQRPAEMRVSMTEPWKGQQKALRTGLRVELLDWTMELWWVD